MEKVKPLLDIMVNYYETSHYIFVHSWLPRGKNWRYATQSKWDKNMWDNPFDIAAVAGNKTGKTIVHGHWHNSYWWSNHGVGSEFGSDTCFNICEHDGCIGLDGCIAYSDQCNVLVLQDDLLT